jgi:hypothetical protein
MVPVTTPPRYVGSVQRLLWTALASDPERAKVALAHIGALFALERALVSTPAKKRREARQARAAPVVDNFFQWCDQEAPRVLDESPIAQAIGYARNQQQALRRFLEDGRLPLHNNVSELNLRREVTMVSLCVSSSSARNRKGPIISPNSTRALYRATVV